MRTQPQSPPISAPAFAAGFAPAFARAFTLVEVMISVAIAVVLMLGIAQVFRTVGDTVGTGQALATAQRDKRAAEATFNRDFTAAVTDGSPYMILYSQQRWAFKNQADLLSSRTGDPSKLDVYGTGSESAQPPAVYNDRSHRVDAISFFARGNYARQTGAEADSTYQGQGPFVAPMSGQEALIWYGHLNLADNNGTFTTGGGVSNAPHFNTDPGIGTSTMGAAGYYGSTNPNNYFASNWILGRQQIILLSQTTLSPQNSTIAPQRVVDQNGLDQYTYLGGASPLSSLAYNSVACASETSAGTGNFLTGASGGTFSLLSSRLDLAADVLPFTPIGNATTAQDPIVDLRNAISSYITSGSSPAWWTLAAGGPDITGNDCWRFQAQPFFLNHGQSKLNAEQLAYQVPILIRGCTQFTVEYAGDYLNQTTSPTSGATIANQGITDTYFHKDGSPGSTDGQVDYYLVSGSTASGFVQKTRWYGLPRSASGTGSSVISLANGDIVPLRDTLSFAAALSTLANGNPNPGNFPSTAIFERLLPTNSYSAATNYVTALLQNKQYVCAWGPTDPRPKMIRITLTIDDPAGRLGSGQTYEYIYTLP